MYLLDPSADGKRNISRKYLLNGKLIYSLSPVTFLVIGTISPDYFITSIQEAYRKRKEKHDLQTEQYIKMSTEMMNLVGASSRISKGKHSQR